MTNPRVPNELQERINQTKSAHRQGLALAHELITTIHTAAEESKSKSGDPLQQAVQLIRGIQTAIHFFSRQHSGLFVNGNVDFPIELLSNAVGVEDSSYKPEPNTFRYITPPPHLNTTLMVSLFADRISATCQQKYPNRRLKIFTLLPFTMTPEPSLPEILDYLDN